MIDVNDLGRLTVAIKRIEEKDAEIERLKALIHPFENALRKIEQQGVELARLRAEAAPSGGLRVDTWVGLNCGDQIYRNDDERHVGAAVHHPLPAGGWRR